MTKPIFMAETNGILQRKCTCGQHNGSGGECEECKKKRKGVLQRAAIKNSPTYEVPPIVHEVLRSPGQSLDGETRAFMEPRFGHDFSDVRVHTDARAAESARAVNANAYTIGNHIAFGSGQYSPQKPMGQRLLAHELTHVVQQDGYPHTIQRKLKTAQSERQLEREAALTATSIMNKEPFHITTNGMKYIARQDASTQPTTNTNNNSTPSFLKSASKDFCQPFASRREAQEAHAYAINTIIPALEGFFGTEVGELWRTYLNRKNGESLARRIYANPSSQIVKGFVNSGVILERQKQLLDLVKVALPSNCPKLPPNIPIDFPLAQFVSSKDELEFPINFNDKFEIPGNIAGGVSGSDAGPDLRQVSGAVILQRDVDKAGRTTGIQITTNFKFVILDAIDFCPGGKGAPDEEPITTLLSRLEATGIFLRDEPFAYDVPYKVIFFGNSIVEYLNLALVKRCFPDVSTNNPTQSTPTPRSPSDRNRSENSERR